VQELQKKIEAAAEARLTLPGSAAAAEKLACYKGFLKVQTHRLKLLHRAGAGGREICEAGRQSWMRCCGTCGRRPKAACPPGHRRNFRHWRWWVSAVTGARN